MRLSLAVRVRLRRPRLQLRLEERRRYEDAPEDRAGGRAATHGQLSKLRVFLGQLFAYAEVVIDATNL